MARYQTVIQSGRVREIYRYEAIRIPNEDRRSPVPRLPNEGKSGDEIKKANLIRAKNKLWRLVNCNFSEDDYFYTLTYKNKSDADDAEKQIRNFIRRLARYCEKHGLPKPKYIGVTETGEGDEIKRPHHHLILSGSLSPKEIRKIWGKGKVIGSPLDPTENYKGLSDYICKEFALSSGGKKRWFQSKNLIRPTVTRTRLKRRTRPITSIPKYKILAHEFVSNEYGYREYVIAVKNETGERKRE
jgi:hypothetical protein